MLPILWLGLLGTVSSLLCILSQATQMIFGMLQCQTYLGFELCGFEQLKLPEPHFFNFYKTEVRLLELNEIVSMKSIQCILMKISSLNACSISLTSPPKYPCLWLQIIAQQGTELQIRVCANLSLIYKQLITRKAGTILFSPSLMSWRFSSTRGSEESQHMCFLPLPCSHSRSITHQNHPVLCVRQLLLVDQNWSRRGNHLFSLT